MEHLYQPHGNRVEDPTNKHCTCPTHRVYKSLPSWSRIHISFCLIMRIVLLITLAVSVAFAQFAQQYPQQYTTRQYGFQQPGFRFNQYSSNNGYNPGYGTTAYSNSIYGTTPTTQYGQYGYGTTPSTYGTTNNQYGYGTTTNGRQYDQNYWNGVGSTTALMAVITTAVAYIL
ncbi:unnamed protein product [Cylicocyclus nassatus]|uniref:Uncharacterized protein n=1 Tax=Cylicocyclus nassatus TaxID=53992 RepID=A0AA36DQ35_CYLNA|nr:unnamed protein product [Cylicocyclus nassatus]